MNTRNTSRKSTSPTVSERLRTKKELEVMKYKPCPPTPRRRHYVTEYLKRKVESRGDGVARPIYFNYPTRLSKYYEPKKPSTYFRQLYAVGECIGEGSFGIVYRARNRENNNYYAIKMTKCYVTVQPNYDEIRCLEKIGVHENLVRYYFAWQEKAVIYMQLELCALSLATYTKYYHKLSNSQLWDIFIDMLKALEHLHSRNIIHLDIKPDNIMISKEGVYKLGDFDMLRDLNEPTIVNGLRSSKNSEGDAKYLAKEVLQAVYTPAADVFSLGISMLELACDVILPGDGPMWHYLRDGTFTSEYFKMVPAKLRDVITKMMVPQSEQRPSVMSIFKMDNVKRAMIAQISRVNYYTLWKADHPEDDLEPIIVRLNTPPPRNVENNGDEGTAMPPPAAVCVTPPKAVSGVILNGF